MNSGSASATPKSSVTSRLLPMPGTPTTVTSCGRCSRRMRSNALTSRSSSSIRPTSGAAETVSTVGIDLAWSASQTASCSDLPFAVTGSRWVYSIVCRVARQVCSPTSTPFTGAAVWRRAAVLTTSPVAIPSPSAGLAPRSTSASPVLTAILTWRSSSSRAQSLIARAARTARSGSSSCATGAPNRAMTASPMNFSTVPP